MYCANGITDKIKPMFEYADDSTLYAFFEGNLGNAYCDSLDIPKSAVIVTGDIVFVTGDVSFAPDVMKLVKNNRYATFIPDKPEWFDALNSQGKKLLFLERYHTSLPKNGFNVNSLEKIKAKISNHQELTLEEINDEYYQKALKEEWSMPFVSNFKNSDEFKKHGFGYVITKSGEIVCGTSCFSYYKKGVEIEVSTREDFRGRGLAQITSAAFILECLKRGLTPHWDARNKASLAIARHMRFEFKDSYISFEFDQEEF